jgi:hypothetical protein
MMFLDTKLLCFTLIFCYLSLSEGGTSPRFLIIDDGWQQIESKPKDADCAVQEGAQ